MHLALGIIIAALFILSDGFLYRLCNQVISSVAGGMAAQSCICRGGLLAVQENAENRQTYQYIQDKFLQLCYRCRRLLLNFGVPQIDLIISQKQRYGYR